MRIHANLFTTTTMSTQDSCRCRVVPLWRGRGCNMTQLFSEEQYFSVWKILIAAYKFVIQSNYINKTETKKKQRPAAYDTAQFSSPFGNKEIGFCMHRSSVFDYLAVVQRLNCGRWDLPRQWLFPLHGADCCREVKIRVNVWTVRRDKKLWPWQGGGR